MNKIKNYFLLLSFIIFMGCGKKQNAIKSDNISISERGIEYSLFQEKDNPGFNNIYGDVYKCFFLKNSNLIITYEDGNKIHLYLSYIDSGNVEEIDALNNQKAAEIIQVSESGNRIYLLSKVYDGETDVSEFIMMTVEKNQVVEKKTIPEEVVDAYSDSVICNNGKLCVLNTYGNIKIYYNGEIFNIDGNKKEFRNIVKNTEDKVYALSGGISTEKNCQVYEINCEKNKIVNRFDLNDVPLAKTIIDGSGRYDFYILSENEIIGYNTEEKYAHVVADFINSGLPQPLNAILPNEDTIMFTESLNGVSDSDIIKIRKYVRIPADVIKNKKQIKLAMFNGISRSMRGGPECGLASCIKKYNERSKEYYITVVDYSDYWPEEAEKLGVDVASGKKYDIYALPSGTINGMSSYQFVRKGLFADLTDFYNECEIEILPNVKKCLESNGKIYFVPGGFSYVGLDIDNSVLSEKNYKNLNIDKLYEYYAEENQVLTRLPSAHNIFMVIGMPYIYSCLDLLNGTTDINEENIVKLLEISKKYERSDWETKNDINEGIINRGVIDIGYQHLGEELIRKNHTFAGFTSAEEKGIYMDFYDCLAMYGQSENREGVYDFFKFMLSEEIHDIWTYFQTPITQTTFKKRIEKCSTEGKELMEYIDDHCEKAMFIDIELENIVSEEIATFFDGEKSSKECAHMLKDRINLYVSE